MRWAGAKSVLNWEFTFKPEDRVLGRRLHEMCIAAWQEILGDLESRGIFSTANNLHIECVRFCFTQIIQHELDLCRQEWNDHQIRRQNGDEVHGKPEILYYHPDLYGTRDYAFPVEMEDVATFRSFCKTPTLTGCEEPLQTTLFGLLESIGRMPPETVDEAKDLLQWLTNYFQ
ncbi:uncharacterized protein LOC128552597 [Mercenaria mercenaria]|uniref:uncharacterized protein LOC128552597 n=1 Tax=Mercenaria mercenaria TaxID=6596 RepID=UPI00234F6FAF|nr:uncharacterized protein LOC128552597 [Mercenaria mercenaria]